MTVQGLILVFTDSFTREPTLGSQMEVKVTCHGSVRPHPT